MNNDLLFLLKSARTSKQFTQKDVAEKLGVKDNTISNWEKGKTEPDIETFVKLCQLYEVDFAELLEKVYRPQYKEQADEFSKAELNHIRKYRSLTPDGKKTVDVILDNQYEQVKPKIKDAAM